MTMVMDNDQQEGQGYPNSDEAGHATGSNDTSIEDAEATLAGKKT